MSTKDLNYDGSSRNKKGRECEKSCRESVVFSNLLDLKA